MREIKEIKLYNAIDIIRYLKRYWYVYILALLCLWLGFYMKDRQATEIKWQATAQAKVEYTVQNILDYDTSIKIASGYNAFTVQQNIIGELQNKAGTPLLQYQIAAIPFSNLINIHAVSLNEKDAMLYANGILDHLVDKSDTGDKIQEIYSPQFLATTANSLPQGIGINKKILYSIFLLAVIIIALLCKELWRCTIVTPREAMLCGDLNLCFHLHPSNIHAKDERKMFFNYLEKKQLNEVTIIPVSMQDYNAQLVHALAKENRNLHFADSILRYPHVIQNTLPAFILLAKGKCDYRDYQRALLLCKEADIKVLGVLLG
ncbi:MAG: hypothetical protein SPL05_08565 [Eubacteriales bacterium]|nr:hypothetical protein [Eubacteriales bacterium]